MMRRELAMVVALLITGGHVFAQRSSLDALEAELKEAKQQHQEVSEKALSNFFSQVDVAMGNPDVAIALYQKAGGILPDPTPVVTEHQSESASEREGRLTQDKANQAALGTVLQLHCGIMHYAALFVVKPDQKGLSEDWAGWLQRAAAVYPQLSPPAPSSDPANPDLKRHRGGGFNPAEIMSRTMRDSPISHYLAFYQFANKEQGNWSVRNLPAIYKGTILDPLRAKPTAATLAAWNVYIAMLSADEKDQDRWDHVVYPPLLFDRSCDDYGVRPGTEKIEALVNLIKANPTIPQVDDWIARTKQLMDDYRASHTRAPVVQNPAPTPMADPNVTITSIQQGDATIITTHTNPGPVNPTPPAP